MHALFVDDEVEFLQLMEKRLSRRGMTIVTAPDGQSALDIVTEAMKQPETMFQVVVMDVRMPGMDGLKATRILREYARFDNLPIIAMTAHAMNGDREKSLSVGMQDYIAKPIEPSVLLSTLARWIHRDGRSPRR